jgi:hypothetical protein
MWYDADIDAAMTRTAMRSIPRGRVSRIEALVFGFILAGSASCRRERRRRLACSSTRSDYFRPFS